MAADTIADTKNTCISELVSVATIIPISGKTGTRWRATVKKFADGKLVINKSRTFDKQKSAETWARKLEAELDTPEGLAIHTGQSAKCMSLADLIARYVAEIGTTKPLGETKSTVLRILSESPFAQRPANEITSQDVVAFCRERNRTHGTGAAAFKKNWGFEGQPLAYASRSVHVPRAINPLNPKYALMIAVWKRLPVWAAKLAGPPIARGLG